MRRALFLLLLSSAAFADSTVPRPSPGNPGEAPWRGAADPLVTIVEFADYQCPYCARVEATLQKVLETWPNEVRVVFRNFPLPFHKQAEKAARDALAARKSGRFWEEHDRLFTNQRRLEEILAFELPPDPGADRQLAADAAEVKRLGVNATPSFFINGRPLTGAQPFESFQKIIEEELQKARKR